MSGKRVSLETLVLYLAGDAKDLNKTIDKVEQKMGDAQRRLTARGVKLSLSVTAPLATIAAVGIKAFATWDKAMTESLAIMGDVSDDMRAKMGELTKTLSNESLTSANELAKAYYYLASAGMTAAQAMGALETVNQFAIAGAFDMARATDLLTDAQTALGLSSKNTETNQKELARIANVLVRANTLANASVEQFAISLTTKSASAARLLGMELEELVSILAVYANQGVKAELAGERTHIMLRDLQTAVLENGAVWEQYKVQVYDAQGEFRKVSEIIRELTNATEGLSDKQKKMMLLQLGFTDRAMAALLPMLGMADMMEFYGEQLQEGGFLQEVYNKQMASFSAQLTMTKNQIVNAAMGIGEILAPALLHLNGLIQQATAYWNGLSPATKTIVVGLGAVAGAVGPTLLAISALYTVTIRSKAALIEMGAGLKRLAVAYYAHKVAVGGSTVANKYHAISSAYMQAEMVRNAAATTAAAATEAKALVATQYVRKQALLTGTVAAQAAALSYAGSMGRMVITTTTTTGNITAQYVRIGNGAIIMAAKVDAAVIAINASMLRLPGAAASAAATVGGSMRYIAGTTMPVAAGTQIVDAQFRKVAVSGKAAAVGITAAGAAASAAGPRMAALARFGRMFKVEIALLAGYLAYKLTGALTGATQAQKNFADQLERTNKLSGQQRDNTDKRQQAQLDEINSIEDLDEKEAEIKRKLEMANREWIGLTEWIDAGKKAIAEKRAELDALGSSALDVGIGGFSVQLPGGSLVGGALESVNKEQQANEAALEETRQQAKDAFDYTVQLQEELGKVAEQRAKIQEEKAEAVNLDATSMEKHLLMEIETFGMSNRAIELYKLQKEGLSDADAEHLRIKIAEIEAMELAKELAEETRQQQADDLKTKEDYVAQLEFEAATLGMSRREADLYRISLLQLSTAQRQAAEAAIETLDAHDRKLEGERLVEEMMTPYEKYQKRYEEIKMLHMDGFIDEETKNRAVDAALDDYNRMMEKLEEEPLVIDVKFNVDALSKVELQRQIFLDSGLSGLRQVAENSNPYSKSGKLFAKEHDGGLAFNDDPVLKTQTDALGVLRNIEKNTANPVTVEEVDV